MADVSTVAHCITFWGVHEIFVMKPNETVLCLHGKSHQCHQVWVSRRRGRNGLLPLWLPVRVKQNSLQIPGRGSSPQGDLCHFRYSVGSLAGEQPVALP
jgi:hypothetical protein